LFGAILRHNKLAKVKRKMKKRKIFPKILAKAANEGQYAIYK